MSWRAILFPEAAKERIGQREHEHDAQRDGDGDLDRLNALADGEGIVPHYEIIGGVVDARSRHEREYPAHQEDDDRRSIPSDRPEGL